jgi:hypothetical protein
MRPIILAGDSQRAFAKQCIDAAKPMSVVTVKDPTRTNIQSAKMWAMLGDVSRQSEWHGMKLTDNDWKLLFLDGLYQELRLVPNYNGTGFVNLGRSSSVLTIPQMSDMIELMYEHGARTGVNWTEKENGKTND